MIMKLSKLEADQKKRILKAVDETRKRMNGYSTKEKARLLKRAKRSVAAGRYIP